MKRSQLNRLLERLRSRDWSLSDKYSSGPQDEDEFEYFAATLDDYMDNYLDDDLYSSVGDVIDDLREISDAREGY
jgi:hypothetical protein